MFYPAHAASVYPGANSGKLYGVGSGGSRSSSPARGFSGQKFPFSATKSTAASSLTLFPSRSQSNGTTMVAPRVIGASLERPPPSSTPDHQLQSGLPNLGQPRLCVPPPTRSQTYRPYRPHAAADALADARPSSRSQFYQTVLPPELPPPPFGGASSVGRSGSRTPGHVGAAPPFQHCSPNEPQSFVHSDRSFIGSEFYSRAVEDDSYYHSGHEDGCDGDEDCWAEDVFLLQPPVFRDLAADFRALVKREQDPINQSLLYCYKRAREVKVRAKKRDAREEVMRRVFELLEEGGGSSGSGSRTRSPSSRSSPSDGAGGPRVVVQQGKSSGRAGVPQAMLGGRTAKMQGVLRDERRVTAAIRNRKSELRSILARIELSQSGPSERQHRGFQTGQEFADKINQLQQLLEGVQWRKTKLQAAGKLENLLAHYRRNFLLHIFLDIGDTAWSGLGCAVLEESVRRQESARLIAQRRERIREKKMRQEIMRAGARAVRGALRSLTRKQMLAAFQRLLFVVTVPGGRQSARKRRTRNNFNVHGAHAGPVGNGGLLDKKFERPGQGEDGNVAPGEIPASADEIPARRSSLGSMLYNLIFAGAEGASDAGSATPNRYLVKGGRARGSLHSPPVEMESLQPARSSVVRMRDGSISPTKQPPSACLPGARSDRADSYEFFGAARPAPSFLASREDVRLDRSSQQNLQHVSGFSSKSNSSGTMPSPNKQTRFRDRASVSSISVNEEVFSDYEEEYNEESVRERGEDAESRFRAEQILGLPPLEVEDEEEMSEIPDESLHLPGGLSPSPVMQLQPGAGGRRSVDFSCC